MGRLFHWLAGRSLRGLHRLGAVLGWLAWLASRRYRRLLRSNAGRAGLSAAQRRAAVAEAGKLAAELPWLWVGAASQPISRHLQWQGEALIDELLAAGRGLLVLTPHLGSFEVCAQAYAERWGARHPATVLYRPARQPWLRELEQRSRQRPGLATAPTTLAGVRQMLRALRRGEAVGLLPDQVPPEGQGVWAPFFGQPAYTMTLAARLLRQTGAPAAVMWARRLPRGAGFGVQVLPLPVALPARAPGVEADAEARAAAEVADAAAVNAAMEAVIRLAPEQYLWGYDRYKRPRRGRHAG
jgi:KDO2-lipid IV(A) lauroyltransferase